MKLAKGNRALAAQALGRDVAWINNRISCNQQMSAVYATNPKVPDEVSTIVKPEGGKPTVVPATDNLLGMQIMKQDMELLRKGLSRAGIKQETIELLRIFEDFSDNTGRFLVCTLDVTHRMQVYQAMALFEEAEHIRKTYLKNEVLAHEIKLEWQRRYNEISELLGKTFDRTLIGTETIARMLKGSKPVDVGKKKPKFTPQRAPRQVN
jgi:hypothetical protein